VCTPFNSPFSFTRIVDSAIRIGPFYNENDIPFNETNIRDISGCNILYASMDVTTQENVKGFVWTWDENEPSQKDGCTILNHRSGRWGSENCNQQLKAACQSESNVDHWVVSERISNFENAKNTCPKGFVFSHPKNPFYNNVLRQMSNDKIWINFK
jgi:hypothetical protein